VWLLVDNEVRGLVETQASVDRRASDDGHIGLTADITHEVLIDECEGDLEHQVQVILNKGPVTWKSRS